jgi:uncharacterized membrane protein YozB (DUF420 family)
MPREGFLGTSAPLSADIALAIEIAMGLTLIIGMVLARRQRYRSHTWCQSTVVVLNLIVIALVMAPSFRSQVAPKIPARLAHSYYAVATAHATMGCIAELLGLYIILVAGTRIPLPKRLRFVRYKPWMRTELVIWWLALLLGVATYVRWYIAPKPIAPPSPSSSQVGSARGSVSAKSCGITISPMDDGACLLWAPVSMFYEAGSTGCLAQACKTGCNGPSSLKMSASIGSCNTSKMDRRSPPTIIVRLTRRMPWL